MWYLAVYSSRRFIDDQVHGLTGSGIGAYMVIPGVGYESSSGGPFFRCVVYSLVCLYGGAHFPLYSDIDFQGSEYSSPAVPLSEHN